MSSQLRLLVIDAYDAEGRAALESAGATTAGKLYAEVLRQLAPASLLDVAEIEGRNSSLLARLTDYSGVVWSGSNLSIHRIQPIVQRQVELARAAYVAGVPQFGSCWAAQIAVVAAGGSCAANPRGREFGVAREVSLTPQGQKHPLLRGRQAPFDALCSHEDIVTVLPAGAEHLALNAFCEVQAVAVRYRRGAFWAVQYHPEYDAHEVARLAALRRDQLITEGRFADMAEADRFIEDFSLLHASGFQAAAAKRQQVSEALLRPEYRHVEIRNWLQALHHGETV